MLRGPLESLPQVARADRLLCTKRANIVARILHTSSIATRPPRASQGFGPSVQVPPHTVRDSPESLGVGAQR
jgi:hypothetical protein